MNIQEIRNFSRETKAAAKKILRETGVEKILSKYGKVIVGGSYALGLMYGPDIDISVETKHPRESSLKALNAFLIERKFQEPNITRLGSGHFPSVKKKEQKNSLIKLNFNF